ncbi:MFS transporter [Phaeacidiphilus oryzae]|uniref:MFS transporter n=1 Tax=Phaeacidiphilus oryzae TaxID=348818 RepID=UPI00055E6B99|nr:MFS transporter [Phaeacidiphilus oryzae]
MSGTGLLRAPHVPRLLGGSLVGRLPAAMATVAIPLTLRGTGAGYGFVGLAAGLFALATALGGPLLGRLVDRVGQSPVLLPAAVGHGVGLVAVALAPTRPAVVLLGALLAGASSPPLEPCLRALWPDVVGEEALEAAYSLDSASQELVFIGAPLVVSACAAVGSPRAALAVGALLGLAGVLTMASAPPARRWQSPPRAPDPLGPLRSPGLVILLVSLTGVGTALGVLNVFAVSYAEGHRMPGGAPTLLALNAGGALIGGVAYGAWAGRWTASPVRRSILLTAGLAVAYGFLCLTPAPPFMAALMLLTGLFLSPVLAAGFVLVGSLAPTGTSTEAFAWLVTLMNAGVAVGAALVGALLQRTTLPWAASCGAIGAAAGLAVLLLGRRRLRRPAPVGPRPVQRV